MANIEIEQRGLLSESDFNRIDKFLSNEGKFLGEKKRFSVIASNSTNSIREEINQKIDLRVRITNGKSELVLKHGKWGSKDSRREINITFDTGNFEEMVEFIRLVGFHKVVLQATITRCYKHNGIEFALVRVPNWGYYFEAEIITQDPPEEKAHQKIKKEIEKLGLRVASEEEYYNLLDSLNNRDGYRIDLNKVDFKEITKCFDKYFNT